MKRVIIIILLFIVSIQMPAQGLSNLFSQKAADIKYMLAQIALLQVYIGDVEKGYLIAQSGLSFISKIKKGEFDLHSLFFSSLQTVNPSVEKYSRVGDILSLQQEIVSTFNKSFQQLSGSKQFSADEWSYLNGVHAHFMEACSTDLDGLQSVISDGVLEMTDDERIRRIDDIYFDMKDKLAFAQSFTADAALLGMEKSYETYDIQQLKKLE